MLRDIRWYCLHYYFVFGAKIVERRAGRIAAIRWVRSRSRWPWRGDLNDPRRSAGFMAAKLLVLKGESPWVSN